MPPAPDGLEYPSSLPGEESIDRKGVKKETSRKSSMKGDKLAQNRDPKDREGRINTVWRAREGGKRVAQNRDKTMERSPRPVIARKREAMTCAVGGKNMMAKLAGRVL